MAHLAALVRDNTTLDRDQVSHLNRLTSEWGMLADFCFADLLLYVPTKDDRWLIVGQVRPATSQTVYHTDWVGTFANVSEQSVLAAAFSSEEITEGDVKIEDLGDTARMLAVPVRSGARPVAVMTREWVQRAGRQQGELERTYLSIFDTFAQMIAEGSFPYPTRVGDAAAAPQGGRRRDEPRRRGAGHATSHRTPTRHCTVSASTPTPSACDWPSSASTTRWCARPSSSRCRSSRSSRPATSPCCAGACRRSRATRSTGGVLLVRDVTDLRKRDRLLISKDATIREIHHRVKNNLQTISSLLRLQARRLENPEAKAAVSESVRRIRTIALVHESLSREPGDDVTFIEIVRPLLRLAEESLQSPDRPVQFALVGDGGRIPARVATPLSVVLTELLQNAVDHGFPEGSGGGKVVVALTTTASGCRSRSSTTAAGSSPASTSTRRPVSDCRSCARS